MQTVHCTASGCTGEGSHALHPLRPLHTSVLWRGGRGPLMTMPDLVPPASHRHGTSVKCTQISATPLPPPPQGVLVFPPATSMVQWFDGSKYAKRDGDRVVEGQDTSSPLPVQAAKAELKAKDSSQGRGTP